MSIDYTEAEERLKLYADTIGVEKPARLLCEEGAPSPELLRFCMKFGTSLDWLFCGDVRKMIRDSYTVARHDQ